MPLESDKDLVDLCGLRSCGGKPLDDSPAFIAKMKLKEGTHLVGPEQAQNKSLELIGGESPENTSSRRVACGNSTFPVHQGDDPSRSCHDGQHAHGLEQGGPEQRIAEGLGRAHAPSIQHERLDSYLDQSVSTTRLVGNPKFCWWWQPKFGWGGGGRREICVDSQTAVRQ